MSKLPNFLIAGTTKCATTSLYHYLGQHSDVYMSKVKETSFFTHNYPKGLDFYSNYFSEAGNALAIGEATPSYSFLPFAIDRIRHSLPNVKLIVTIRNPVDRAFSHWLMFREGGIEKKSFREAIEINLRQMEMYDFSGEAGANLWNERRYMIGNDDRWPRIYIQPGLYAENISRLYNYFNKDQVKIVFVDDLKNSFNLTMQSIFRFLNITEQVTIENSDIKNFYYDKKYYRALQNIVGVKTARGIIKIIPSNLKTAFKQSKEKVSVPRISVEDKLFLDDIYKKDIHALAKMVNRDLGKWF